MILFDEPLSNLDAKLRIQTRIEIRKLLKQAGITALYVTHDQEEALTISDRIAVMDKGSIEQVSSPLELYNAPKTSFVASFIGQANLFSGNIVAEGNGVWFYADNGMRIATVPPASQEAGNSLLVRPENLFITAERTNADNCFSGNIIEKQYLGNMIRYNICLSTGSTVIAQIHPDNDVPTEKGVYVNFAKEKTVLVANGNRPAQ